MRTPTISPSAKRIVISWAFHTGGAAAGRRRGSPGTSRCRRQFRSIYLRWPARSLFISNIVTFFLPKTGSSLSSARISRLFWGFCRLYFLIWVQILLTASVRGNGLSPTTCANSRDGCNGFIRPELLFAAALRPDDFFGGAL